MTRHLLTPLFCSLALAAVAAPMPASAEAAKPPAPATLAAPAEFKQRADELVLIFNGERQPSASFSQLALEKGKISAKQLDERLGKFTGQARDKFGRVDGIVEVLAVGPHEAIVVLSGKKEELPVRLTLEPAPPYGIVGIGAGPAVNLEAALRREMAAAGGSASQP